MKEGGEEGAKDGKGANVVCVYEQNGKFIKLQENIWLHVHSRKSKQ